MDNIERFYNQCTFLSMNKIAKEFKIDVCELKEAFDEYYLSNVDMYDETIFNNNISSSSFVYVIIEILLNRIVGYSNFIDEMGEDIIIDGKKKEKSIKKEEYEYLENMFLDYVNIIINDYYDKKNSNRLMKKYIFS